MKLQSEILDGGITLVSLDGRLDVQGALAVDAAFSKLAEDSKHMLVDLSAVSFLASLGIRMLVAGAKTLSNAGGELVLMAPQENVQKVLVATGIDTVIPIKRYRQEALAVFGK